jgi:hypothetical protein
MPKVRANGLVWGARRESSGNRRASGSFLDTIPARGPRFPANRLRLQPQLVTFAGDVLEAVGATKKFGSIWIERCL